MYCETPPYGDLGNLVNLWSLFSGPAEWSYIILQKNSHLLSLYIFNRSSGESLLKYQLDSSYVIMSLILLTTVFHKAVILLGEI